MEPSATDRHPDDPGSLWDFFRAWWPAFRQRVFGPPPPTEADFIPPGAEPICPTCVQPYPPLLSRCPHCHEYVGAYNTILYLDWIYIWGRGMSDVVWRRRLTPLLRAGLAVLSVKYLADSASSGAAVARAFRDLGDGQAAGLGEWLSLIHSVVLCVFGFVIFVALTGAQLRDRAEVTGDADARE